MSTKRNAYCYISIELNGDLASETPLATISSLLTKATEWVETFDEDQNFEEFSVLRGDAAGRYYRVKLGQVDLHVEDCE